jgi:hypothetical protein
MSARLRAGSLCLMKAGACMKPDFGFLFGVLVAPNLPVLIANTGMAWDFMEINRKSSAEATRCCFRSTWMTR